MIPFNKPCVTGMEQNYIQEALQTPKLSGNGTFGKKCTDWLEDRLGCTKALLTPSCTAALEMSAILIDVQEGDEIIMPSYTFVSTANAFALRGASIRFVDAGPATMNIAPVAIEEAITERTKAIVVVHYAGVACEMEQVMEIADRHQLWVVEDAAQALLSTYKGKALGTIGHFGTISFHETKNYTCGEGGALLINHPAAIDRAEILQEKGTDRSQFLRGAVDKYTWRDIGSSYLLSDLNAAYLYAQLEYADEINDNRITTWKRYEAELSQLEIHGHVSLPHVPVGCIHNAHMFYIKTKDGTERGKLIQQLKEDGVMAVSHYVPLHTSHAGEKYGTFVGEDRVTTKDSDRLVRLPLYYGIGEEDIAHVVSSIYRFYQI